MLDTPFVNIPNFQNTSCSTLSENGIFLQWKFVVMAILRETPNLPSINFHSILLCHTVGEKIGSDFI